MQFPGHPTGSPRQKESGLFARRRKNNLGGRSVHWPGFAELLGFLKDAPIPSFFRDQSRDGEIPNPANAAVASFWIRQTAPSGNNP